MKFTLSWLKDHLDTSADVKVITETLTAIGLEVEEVIDLGSRLSSFEVAEIINIRKHPDADRLQVCDVKTSKEDIVVVCGAKNVVLGLKAVLARPGNVIPQSGQKLKTGKIRGVLSEGMLCSGAELGLTDDSDGILELDVDARVGSPISEALQLEPVIDIALTPNRVDALGVRGVARDLAAAGLGVLKDLDTSTVATCSLPTMVVNKKLSEKDAGLCPHFVGRAVHGVVNCESPDWLKKRLADIGLRSVSALVDITQYITIDLGRPLHVFDADKLNGPLGPRLATDGEKILAINGNEYKLTNNMLVISDDSCAQAIAGIMGGEHSACSTSTKNIVIESALFDPSNIATTGRALGVLSDSRYCFERGVDPESTLLGIEIATRMVLELCGGQASDLATIGRVPDTAVNVGFRPNRILELGGVNISNEEIENILVRLGFSVNSDVSASWVVRCPSWRGDISGENDLVEEVLRIYGYESIPIETLPALTVPSRAFSTDQWRIHDLRRTLAGRGLFETTTWSFIAKENAELFGDGAELVELENPISSDLGVMRPSLLPNLLLAAKRNVARGVDSLSLFEIGPKFEGSKPGEQTLLSSGIRLGSASEKHWSEKPREFDVFDVKADAIASLAACGVSIDNLKIASSANQPMRPWYHPGQCGTLCLGLEVIAEFGVIHPLVRKNMGIDNVVVGFEVFAERALRQLSKKKKNTGVKRSKFNPSLFQMVERDFAFVLDANVATKDVMDCIRKVDVGLIKGVKVFDVYVGTKIETGKKSVAFSVQLEPSDHTMTDEEIEAISESIIAAVDKSVGGYLRT